MANTILSSYVFQYASDKGYCYWIRYENWRKYLFILVAITILLGFKGLVLTLDLKKDDIISTISKTPFSQYVTDFHCHPAQTKSMLATY